MKSEQASLSVLRGHGVAHGGVIFSAGLLGDWMEASKFLLPENGSVHVALTLLPESLTPS